MKLEVWEEASRPAPLGEQRRVWDIRNEHGVTVARTRDEDFVRYIQDAEVVNQYIEDATRTESRLGGSSETHDRNLRILHAAMGFATEAGEFMDAMKKFNYYGVDALDLDNLDEEVGDLLWYVAIYLATRKKTFADIMAANIRKLKARYPEKFTSERALNRDLAAEQDALKE